VATVLSYEVDRVLPDRALFVVALSSYCLGAIVTATRNAVDVRKWVASKLMPREYGDQASGGFHDSSDHLRLLMLSPGLDKRV